MTRLVVQCAFGYAPNASSVTWTDITEFVDTQAGVRISRGASDELSETQPATCSMVLDNSDGRFTPTRATSPYYPFVRENCPVRVLVVSADKNLVREGSFEETSPGSGIHSSTGWEKNTDAPPFSNFADGTHAHDGTSAMLINWATSGTGGILQHTVYGLEIGQTYTASAWVYVETGDPAVRLQIADGAAGDPSTVNNAFEQITVTFTATAAVHVLQITTTVTSPVLGDRCWMDAVQVEEGSSPTAFSSDFARLHYRFYGMVNEWPVRWAGLYSSVTITATDLVKWLSLQPELQPMLVEEVLLDGPLAYYPLAEPSDSASAGDLSGQGAGALAITQAGSGGTLEFGQDGGPSDGQTVPELAPTNPTNGKYLVADLGQHFADTSSQNWLFVEGWFHTVTRDRVICALRSDDRLCQIVFLLDSGTGRLRIESTNTGTPLQFQVAGTADLSDGEEHHFVWDEFNSRLYVDGTDHAMSNVAVQADLRHLTVGGYDSDRLWQGTLSHIALHAPDANTVAPGAIEEHHEIGSTEMIGETADVRMARILSYVDLTVDTVGTTFDGMASQKELGSTPITHLRDIERTENGKLATSRQLASLLFQSRDVRFNPTPVASLEYADLETDEVEVRRDDQKLTNILIASRPGGAIQRITANQSIAAFGPYERSVELLKDSDAKVLDAASFTVLRYADPPAEIRQVPVEIYTLPLATYRALLDADISSPITITDLPAEAPASSATVTVEGYTETIEHRRHLVDFHTSRTVTDSVWVLDDTTYSVLGTTTRLAY